MNSNKFWAALGKVAVVAVVLIVILLLAPVAGAASKYEVLYKFTGGADGDQAWSNLIFDVAGNLYGTTAWGGAYGLGTVFKLTHNSDGSWSERVLYSFAGGNDGALTFTGAGLTSDASGNLYGVTFTGGGGACTAGPTPGCGVVFRLTPNQDGTWTESILHTFVRGNDGEFPAATLTLDAAGNLYGATQWGGGKGNCEYDGCGTVFQLTPNLDGSWTENVLHRFTGGKDGMVPDRTGLVFDTMGNLYGTAEWGGRTDCGYGCGLVFKLTPNADGSWTKKVLHYFTGGNDGAWPDGNLVFDAEGNIYGTTFYGGTYGDGTAFRLKPRSGGGWSYQALHQFKGGKDGANSWSGLVFDSAGSLYGTTTWGGAYGYGTVFKLTPRLGGKWAERVLHSFAAHPAAYPCAAVTFDGAGNLYSTTTHRDGNQNDYGAAVVFQITP